MERAVRRVPGRAVGDRDLQSPGQRGRPAEQLLVEVVADAPDRLRHQQGRGDRVHEQAHVRVVPAHPPHPGQRAQRDAAPDAQAAVPDGEDAVPVVRDVLRGGQVEVDAATDDAGRDGPEGDVADQPRVAALCLPAPLGDQDRQRDPDDVHQPVEMYERRADVKAVDRRAGDVQGHGPSVARRGGCGCPGARVGLPAATARAARWRGGVESWSGG